MIVEHYTCTRNYSHKREMKTTLEIFFNQTIVDQLQRNIKPHEILKL